MSKLRNRLVNIIAIGVPLSAHCPNCDRPIAEETVIDMTDSSNKSWDDLIKKALEAIVDQLKEEVNES